MMHAASACESDRRHTSTHPSNPCRDTAGHNSASILQRRSRKHLVHRLADLIHLLFGESQSTGEIKSAPRNSFGIGIALAFKQSGTPINRLLMHRPEEWARSDFLFGEPLHCLICIEWNIV